jgi:glycosyltransferase involved in cell wall biosynthesis
MSLLKLNSLRVAIVTNIPTPYRRPVFEILGAMPDITLKVIYCSAREPDREWDLKATEYDAEYLNDRFVTVGDKFIHSNPEVFGALHRFKPDVVIGTGFNPTHLFAFLYAKMFGCAFVPMTDGTFDSERALSGIHKWVRRRVYRRSKAFIAASDGGFDLYESYNVDPVKIFKSHLCCDNDTFEREPDTQKKYDLIFSGRFSELKNPLFALDVANIAASLLGRSLSLAFLGAGPLEKEMRRMASQLFERVEIHFLGFAKQSELAAIYKKARVMLFPTLADVWGVVANESLAAGVPVIISPVAGCVPELVRHQCSGLVVPLRVELWARAIIGLLNDPPLCQQMGDAGREIVKGYNYHNAAQGIADAARTAGGLQVKPSPENGRAL